MIYFIQAGKDGPIKIGQTNNLPRRLCGLQIGNPQELRVIGVIPEELDLHYQFAHLSLRGEWFEPEDELVQFIHEHAMQEPDKAWNDIEQAWIRQHDRMTREENDE